MSDIVGKERSATLGYRSIADRDDKCLYAYMPGLRHHHAHHLEFPGAIPGIAGPAEYLSTPWHGIRDSLSRKDTVSS